jgi:ribonuclease VapC
MVVDTSALMAVLLDEPDCARCVAAMSTDAPLLISAGTLAEAEIVAGRRGARAALDRLMARLKPEIVPVTAIDARLVADAYENWGKGIHPASLNFGDCFAYALAKARGYPLLFVGNDFALTDVTGIGPVR